MDERFCAACCVRIIIFFFAVEKMICVSETLESTYMPYKEVDKVEKAENGHEILVRLRDLFKQLVEEEFALW